MEIIPLAMIFFDIFRDLERVDVYFGADGNSRTSHLFYNTVSYTPAITDCMDM